MINYIVVKSIDFPSGAASGQYVRLLIKGIRHAGAKACFVSTSNFSQLDANRKNCGYFDGCPYLHVSTGKGTTGFVSSLFRSWRGCWIFVKMLKKRKRRGRKDVILYGNGSPMHDWWLVLGCRISGIPMYGWCVELESAPWSARCGFRERLNYWNGRLAEEWLPKLMQGYIVISRRLESFYRERHHSVMVSPILVDPDVEHDITQSTSESLYSGRKVLVYSGTFEEKDGVHVLLDALKMAIEKNPDLLLVMTGRALRRGGEEIMGKVLGHIQADGLEEYTELTGFVARDHLDEINTRADLFLVCRTGSRFAQYGLPWKLGEYAMTGKPILATDVSDVSVYFRNEQDIFLTKAESPKGIASKIFQVFDNYETAIEVGLNGKQVAKREFDYRRFGRAVLEFDKNLTIKKRDCS